MIRAIVEERRKRLNVTGHIERNAFLLAVILGAGVSSAGSLALKNYSNDPDLALALEYDRETTSDRSKADRALAEKHYLAYLEREEHSWQRARVYSQLGAMFLTSFSKERGEKRDTQKGRMYFIKVLEEEPIRIDWPTVRARTMLASLGTSSEREKRLVARMDNYALFLSLDQDRIVSNWLPLYPDNIEPTAIQRKKMASLLKSLRGSTETNMISDAMSMPDRQVWLERIVKRFPGTEAAELAQAKLIELDTVEKKESRVPTKPAAVPLEIPKSKQDKGRPENSHNAALQSTEAVPAETSEQATGKSGGSYSAATVKEANRRSWKLILGVITAFVIGRCYQAR